MKVSLTFTCGEKTCAIKPGEFCRFLRTRRFGQHFFCNLFEKSLVENDDWLQRLPECLELSRSTGRNFNLDKKVGGKRGRNVKHRPQR